MRWFVPLVAALALAGCGDDRGGYPDTSYEVNFDNLSGVPQYAPADDPADDDLTRAMEAVLAAGETRADAGASRAEVVQTLHDGYAALGEDFPEIHDTVVREWFADKLDALLTKYGMRTGSAGDGLGMGSPGSEYEKQFLEDLKRGAEELGIDPGF